MVVTCSTPYCKNSVQVFAAVNRKYVFCDKCREEHSYHALVVQVDHEKPVQDAIMDAKIFKTASGMADYLGVSFVTLYHWLKKYYNLSFQEFKRIHICKSTKCYLLNIERSSYSRHDYVLKKIRARRYCACINSLEKDHIMTNAPVSVVAEILRGAPRIEQISDRIFALAPTPIYFSGLPTPIYLTNLTKSNFSGL